MKKLITVLFSFQTILSAFEPRSQIDLVGGFQHGKFKQVADFQLPNDIATIDKVTSTLDLGVFGVDGRLFFPYFDSGCYTSYLNDFYITGHAIWGWDNGNHFKEKGVTTAPTGQTLPSDFISSEALSKGRLKRARTYDYKIGLGYLFNFDCWDWTDGWGDGWALGIEGGYAYNGQALRTKHANTGVFAGSGSPFNIFVENDPNFAGNTYTNRWRSGWMGAELFYSSCDWDWSFGYTHYFASFTGLNNRTTAGLAEGYDSYKLKSNRAHGNLWNVKGIYDLGCGWNIGGLFTYEYWNARHGKATITEGVNFLAGNVTSSKIKASWDAYTVAATIGYDF